LEELHDFPWQWLTGVTCKTVERYAIHILEPLFTLTGAGFETVRCHAKNGDALIHLQHRNGRQATIAVLEKATGSFGVFHAFGAKGHRSIQCLDTYTAFRRQLLAVVAWFRTGKDPFPFEETEEMMAILIAAIRSRELDGRELVVRKPKREF
jgi:hypothetical protein